MDGGDDQAAAGAVVGHQAGHQGATLNIQSGCWLIEQPDGPWLDQETRKRQTAFLAGRQAASGDACAAGEAGARHRRAGRLRPAAEIACPEGRLLFGCLGGFDCVEMSKVVAPWLACGPGEGDRAGMGPGQARQNAQKR